MTAYDKALYLLSVREHTRKELETKLSTKGYQKEEMKEALDRLEEENMLSERRFCESYIRSRLRKNPEGKAIIIQRLIEKGVPSSLAHSVADEYFLEHEDEIDGIYKAYKEKVVRIKGEEKARGLLFRKQIRIRD